MCSPFPISEFEQFSLVFVLKWLKQNTDHSSPIWDTSSEYEGTESTNSVEIYAWNTQYLLLKCLTALLSWCQKLSHSEMFQDRTIFSVLVSVLTQMQLTERWRRLIIDRCYDSWGLILDTCRSSLSQKICRRSEIIKPWWDYCYL